jgi:hypothetical protein
MFDFGIFSQQLVYWNRFVHRYGTLLGAEVNRGCTNMVSLFYAFRFFKTALWNCRCVVGFGGTYSTMVIPLPSKEARIVIVIYDFGVRTVFGLGDAGGIIMIWTDALVSLKVTSLKKICIYFSCFQNFRKNVISCRSLGAFAKLLKATVSFVMSVCLSVRLSAWNNSASTGRILMTRDIWALLENLSRKFKFLCNPTRITGTLHEDVFTFMTMSRYILLRMRNVSDKICRENQNTFYVQ